MKKKISKNELIQKAKIRLSNMEYELRFNELVYIKTPTEKLAKRIELLKQDVEELKNQLKIFIESREV